MIDVLRAKYEVDGFVIIDLKDYWGVIEKAAVSTDRISDERGFDRYRSCNGILQLAFNRVVLNTLAGLYDAVPFPFQTLNFPDSPEQGVHSDEIHFSSYPFGLMAGVWVALCDVALDMGPLFVIPGSHKFSHVFLSDLGRSVSRDNAGWLKNLGFFTRHWDELILRDRLVKVPVLLRKGQAVIWASNLLHGSFKKLGGGRRLSQVTHYFFRGGRYCTPGLSDFKSGDIQFREPFELLRYGQSKKVIGAELCGPGA